MLKLTDEQMKACYASGYFRRYTFVFDDFTIDASMIHTESVTIKESICEESEMKLGGCIASSCEFEVAETVTNQYSLNGLRFKAYLHLYKENTEPHLTDDDNTDWAIGEEIGIIPMGVYNVRSVEMVDDQDYKKVTAYDDFYDWNIDVADWYNKIFPADIEKITYTVDGVVIDDSKGIPDNAIQKTDVTRGKMKVKTFREQLLAHLMNVNENSTDEAYLSATSKTYINDDVDIEKSMETTGNVMALDLLRYLCELAGGFGRINRQGFFEIIRIGSGGGLYPENNIFPEDNQGEDGNLYPEDNFIHIGGGADENQPDFISTHCEEFDAQPVSCVTFSMNSTKTTTDESGNTSDEAETIGISYPENATENPYVSSNPLVLNLPAETLRTVAKNVFDTIAIVQYRPNTTQLQGIPYYEVGDYYNITKKSSFEAYVFSRTLSGIQGLRDEFAAQGLKVRENSVSKETESYATMAKYLNITKNTEMFSLEIGDTKANQYTIIQITAQGLTSTVAASQYQWDDNKYQIDEYGFGAPESSYKVKYYWNAGKYEVSPNILTRVDGNLPDIETLPDDAFADNNYYLLNNSGYIYHPKKDGFRSPRTGNILKEYRWWEGVYRCLQKSKINIYDYSASDVGKTYLDQNTGNLYKLVGWNLTSENPQFRWDVIAHLEKVTVQLETKITQTAEEIRLEASRTYATDSYVKSQFQVTAGQISAEVTRAKGAEETLSSNITQTAERITQTVAATYETKTNASESYTNLGSKIDQTATNITQTVYATYETKSNASNSYTNLESKIDQTAHSIELSTTDGEKTAGITIRIRDKDGNVLDSASDNITLTGVVGFEDLSGEGRTTINGANIKTGTIDADRISLQEIASKTNSAILFPSTAGINIGSGSQETRIGNGFVYTNNISNNDANQILRISAIGDLSLSTGETKKVYINNDIYIDPKRSITSAVTFKDFIYARMIKGVSSLDNSAFDIESNGFYIYPGNPGMNVYGKIYSQGVRDSTTSSAANMHCGVNYGQFFRSTASSERYKHDITTDISEPLNPHHLLDVPIKQYKYNIDYLSDMTDIRYNRDVIGFIAEDIDREYPIACEYDEYGMVNDWNARFIIPPMLSLIQECYRRIEVLENKVRQLKNGGN